MKRIRAPQQTRRAVLDAAYRAAWRFGFRGASLGDILAVTGLTKGAFYHHFADKNALGRALIEESLSAYVQDEWLKPLESADDPLDELARLIGRQILESGPEALRLGCPFAALAQDMIGLDDGFRQPLEALYRTWRKGVTKALRQGQQRGQVRADLDAEHTAAFLLASVQGIRSMARIAPAEAAEPARALLAHLAALRSGA